MGRTEQPQIVALKSDRAVGLPSGASRSGGGGSPGCCIKASQEIDQAVLPFLHSVQGSIGTRLKGLSIDPGPGSRQVQHDRSDLKHNLRFLKVSACALSALLLLSPEISRADESGVSFWIPGLFGSLAATPQQPGWSLANIYYHTSVSAGADVARAREFQLGNVPANVTVNANLNMHVNATGDLGLVLPSYVFATPVLGGQASVSLLAAYGVVGTSLAGTLSGVATTPFGITSPFARSDTINDTTWGFGDLAPMFQLKWNSGVNNYMTYITGDIPVGAYQSTRLSNIGIGHGAIDAGGGYTYFNPQTGHEFSGVLGFTYNFPNNSTQYQSGVDMHFDWGASQFLSKEVMAGLVGYVYKEIGCDSGSGDRVGCFQSQVFGVGPQIGFLFPVGDMQGYLNLKAYGEYSALSRPSGWNTWVTFSISPPAPGAPPTTKPIVRKY
jgi:hypothetical protein